MKIHTFQRENNWKSLQICTWKNKINKQKYQHDCCYILYSNHFVKALRVPSRSSKKWKLKSLIFLFLFVHWTSNLYIPPLWPLSMIYSKPPIQGHWFNFHYKVWYFQSLSRPNFALLQFILQITAPDSFQLFLSLFHQFSYT